MIEIDTFTVTNFGPYFGSHTLDFSGKKGVFVVHGGNGHGKTSLLNAFRWAFTGQAKGRVSIQSPNTLINRKAINESGDQEVICKVEIAFKFNGINYLLSRVLTRKSNGQTASTLHLHENSIPLGTADAPTRLAEILPEEIQQFFFFDGELIDQFENLLDVDSRAANELKKAIEAVLGIPVLREAAMRLNDINAKKTKQLQKLNTASDKNQKILKEIGLLQDKERAFRTTIDDCDKKLQRAKQKMADLEQRMKESDAARSQIERKKLLKETEATTDDRLLNRKNELCTAMKGAWRAVLVGVLAEDIDKSRDDLRYLEDEKQALTLQSSLMQFKREAKESGTCPCCGTEISVVDNPVNEESAGKLDGLDGGIIILKNRIKTFDAIDATKARDVIKKKSAEVIGDRANLSTVQAEIKEIEDDLVGVDDDAVVDLMKKYKNEQIIIQEAEKAKNRAEDELRVTKNNIDRLQKALGYESDAVSKSLMNENALLSELANFFDSASDAYREDQKKDVERRATEIFLKTSHQEEYKKLKINDSYGLEIVHRDDAVEVGRSAGFEHIVALSLIGALQGSSPVKGLVVMDSPFGRLDTKHGNNVIKILPEIAPQVLLLVTDRELAVGAVSEILLDDKIISQKVLNHVNARETQISELDRSA